MKPGTQSGEFAQAFENGLVKTYKIELNADGTRKVFVKNPDGKFVEATPPKSPSTKANWDARIENEIKKLQNTKPATAATEASAVKPGTKSPQLGSEPAKNPTPAKTPEGIAKQRRVTDLEAEGAALDIKIHANTRVRKDLRQKAQARTDELGTINQEIQQYRNLTKYQQRKAREK